jgi:hypothetical protein
MKLSDSILFWSAVSAAVFPALSGVLQLCGLRFRTWIREPVTVLTALGGAAGLLQLVLRIPQRRLRILVTVLWAIAALAGLIAGVFVFAFEHLHEERYHPGRKRYEICVPEAVRARVRGNGCCIAERSESVSGYRRCFYEPRLLLFRSTELLGMR